MVFQSMASLTNVHMWTWCTWNVVQDSNHLSSVVWCGLTFMNVLAGDCLTNCLTSDTPISSMSAEHAINTYHDTDWANASIVDSHPHLRARCALEVWHTSHRRGRGILWTDSTDFYQHVTPHPFPAPISCHFVSLAPVCSCTTDDDVWIVIETFGERYLHWNFRLL